MFSAGEIIMVKNTVVKNEKVTAKKVFILKKSVIVTVVAIAMCCLLIVAGIFALNSRKPNKNIDLFYSSGLNGAIVASEGEWLGEILNGKGVAGVKYSLDGDFAAVVMAVDSSYSLYYTDGKTQKHLTADASNNYIISSDGTAVAYSDSSSELYLYNRNNDKITYVDNSAAAFALTPSGEAIVYVKASDDGNVLYLYTDGKSTQIGVDYIPLGISDDLSLIYVLNSDNALCVLNKNGNLTAKICSGVSTDSFYFSTDMANVVFNDGEYTYISMYGQSKIRLIADAAAPLNEKVLYSDSKNSGCVCEKLYETYYCSTDGDNSTLYYINDSLERADIADNIRMYIITDKNSVVYLDSQYSIYKYSKGKNTLIHTDAYSILATSDGKYIYYLNSASELICIKDGKATVVDKNVRKMYITNSNKLLYINRDGELFGTAGKKQGKKFDDNVYACICNNSSVFYLKNYSVQSGVFELYSSDGSFDFELVCNNVSAVV